MRKLRAAVYIENRYPGVTLGAVSSADGLLLIDSPLRSDDVRDWLAQLGQAGRPRYLALLDHHLDRALGGRSIDIPIVAQEETLRVMRGWPDAFRGSAKPIGAEADRLKRITGVTRAVPELSFSKEMLLQIGDREALLTHRPGPTTGSAWVVLQDAKIAFIGDTVSTLEPPYFGDAELEAWMARLDELRGPEFDQFTLISSRDGLIEREHINVMARLLRKVMHRLEQLKGRDEPQAAVGKLAPQLLRDFRLSGPRRDLVSLRLQVGLTALYGRLKPSHD